ncbi:hypothetical protein YC2023_058237 [Brassica napus]
MSPARTTRRKRTLSYVSIVNRLGPLSGLLCFQPSKTYPSMTARETLHIP